MFANIKDCMRILPSVQKIQHLYNSQLPHDKKIMGSRNENAQGCIGKKIIKEIHMPPMRYSQKKL